MPYLYDVFISYKRGRINEQWVEENFLPIFEDYLDNELTEVPRIFLDKTGLAPGVDYRNALFRSLFFSKSLVCIWSPPYFRRSEWCVKEFLTMKYKQDEHYHLGDGTPSALIWPVIFRKLNIPPIAQGMQCLDYSKFAIVGDHFFKSPLYMEFQQQMQSDIRSLVEIIENAPPLDERWETEDGKAEFIQLVNQYFGRNDLDDNLNQALVQWT